jgi:hypothetical protein
MPDAGRDYKMFILKLMIRNDDCDGSNINYM